MHPMPVLPFFRSLFVDRFAPARRELPYAVCALIALAAIWCHRYPVGIDIAQHANLFRAWADYAIGPVEYRSLYRIDPFTPYLLTYVAAYPFALAFGAMVATKCLLSVAALSTPLMMRRWLRTVGADPRFGLFGFLLAFDFPYHWGFLSHSLAIPLMFGYLTAFERQGNRPGWRAILHTLLFGTALFFCHGITFGLCMLFTGLRLILRRHPLRAWRAGLHALPLGAVALLWFASQRQHTTDRPGNDWFATWERLTTLFSGPFTAYPNKPWAVVSGVGLVAILMVARPRLMLQMRRLLPLLVSLACFLILPETLAATWMIGSRFCVFVHAFAPAVVQPHSNDWLARKWFRLAFVWVAAILLILNIRLREYNKEIAGLHELTYYMEPRSDVRTLIPDTVHDSVTMGRAQFGQAAAWLTAERGGLLDNDSSGYYQMPIRRGPVSFPKHYRYIIAKGKVDEVTPKVVARVKNARLVRDESSWLLYEDPTFVTDDFTVVRGLQGWGSLHLDEDVEGAPLAIAGTRYQHGLGTHIDSFIRLRILRSGRTFEGGCGLNDQSSTEGRALFRIRDDAGTILFESGEVRGGEPARRFSVLLEGRKELILEARKVETDRFGHADWVALKVN
jgi:hypothetical protein